MPRTRTAKSPWLLLILAIGMAWAVVHVLRQSGDRTPLELLESARKRLDRPIPSGPPRDRADAPPGPDYSGALHELDLALEQVDQASEPDLMAEILVTRADLYAKRGAWQDAHEDLIRVYDDYRPDDIDLMIQLIEAELRARFLEQAADHCYAFLERAPTHPIAWQSLGRVRQTQQRDLLQTCTLLLADALANTLVYDGVNRVVRIMALEEGDPERLATQHDLETWLERHGRPDLIDELRPLMAEASVRHAEARYAFARSLEHWVNPSALQALLESFNQAGQLRQLADLGLAALPHEGMHQTPEGLQLLAAALRDLGRPQRAAEIITVMEEAEVALRLAYLQEWCGILYEAELWARLVKAATILRQAAQPDERGLWTRSAAEFYLGMGYLGLGELGPASFNLERFVAHPERETFEGAVADGWFALAQAYRKQSLLGDERRALERGLAHEPERDAAAWIRLADLQQQLGNPMQTVELSLAHALALTPPPHDALLARWEEAGRRALFEAGLDLKLTKRNLARQEPVAFYPDRPAGPYELVELARLYAEEEGQAQAVIETTRHALESVPHFPPASDLLVDTLVANGEYQDAAEILLDRLEVSGSNPDVERRLKALPPDTLDSSQVLRLMTHAPSTAGLLAVTRELRGRNELRQAMSGLTAAGIERLGDEGRVLAARILLDLGMVDQVEPILAPVEPGSPYYSRALRLEIEMAMTSTRKGVNARVFREVAEADLLDPQEMLPVCDQLLQRGQAQGATILLERLDSRRESRSGEVMLRLAVAAHLRGDADAAEEALTRAEAYVADGSPIIGRILIGIEDSAWRGLGANVRDLWRSGYRPTPFQEALLSALEDRLDESAQMVQVGRERDRWDADWALLAAAVADLRGEPYGFLRDFGSDALEEARRIFRGSADERSDPRRTLGLLLATESPAWTVLAVRQLEEAPGDRLWLAWLQARAWERSGETQRALDVLAGMNATWPDFGPAWSARERIEEERLGDPDHPTLLALRADRREAVGDDPTEGAERLLADASEDARLGLHAEALAKARWALQAAPELTSGHLLVARMLAATGELSESVASYSRYLSDIDEELALPVLPEFLDVLDTAVSVGVLSSASLTAELGALSVRYPRHPGVALALAHLDLYSRPDYPTLGLARAYARLEEFREATAEQSLEELQPGVLERWLDFLVPLDPKRAEQFVRNELDLDPGSIDLWIALGRTLEAQGRLGEAMEQYELVYSMLPETRAMRRIAQIQAQFGTDHERVMAFIQRIQVLEGLSEPDLQLRVIRANSLVNTGAPRDLDAGIALLADLWIHRHEAPDVVDPLEIGLLYGFALVQRARYQDRDLAESVLVSLEDEVGEESPRRRDLLLAMTNLARNIPEEHYKPEPTRGSRGTRAAAEDAEQDAEQDAAEASGDPEEGDLAQGGRR